MSDSYPLSLGGVLVTERNLLSGKRLLGSNLFVEHLLKDERKIRFGV
jgi:hypothetical protein